MLLSTRRRPSPYIDTYACRNPERLREVVQRYPAIERVACGHIHRSMQLRFGGTILRTAPSTTTAFGDLESGYTGTLLLCQSTISDPPSDRISFTIFPGIRFRLSETASRRSVAPPPVQRWVTHRRPDELRLIRCDLASPAAVGRKEPDTKPRMSKRRLHHALHRTLRLSIIIGPALKHIRSTSPI